MDAVTLAGRAADGEVGEMILTETRLPGVVVIEPEPIQDHRGFFARTWDAREMAGRGLEGSVAQVNESFSKRRGTIRGLHLQRPPHGETKVVRCIRGALFDVAVDLRPDSATYREWFGVELSAANRTMLGIPPGVAHGFQTLQDDTEALYLVSAFFAPEAEGGIRWDDPAVGIAWPLGPPTEISDKDASWPDLA